MNGMTTTLNEICKHSPCAPGLKKLMRSLNKTKADDEPVSIVQIIESNGLDDALWCLRAVEGRDREIRHYNVWCARQVQHLMTDQRSINALDVAERFADGLATQEELEAARVAAKAAVWDSEGAVAVTAAWVAEGAAARSAARDTARDARAADRAASGDAARDDALAAQEKKLRELCAWCDENPIGGNNEQK